MENDPIFHAILLAKRMARGGYADGGDTSDPIAYANSLLGYGDAASQSSLNNSGLPTSLPMGIAPSVAKPSAMQTPGTPSSVQPDISGLSAPAAGQAAPSVAAGPAAPTPSTPAPTPTPAAGKPAAKKDETTSTNTQKRGGRVGYYDGGLIDLDTPVPSTQQNIGLYGIDWGNPDSSADFFRADQQLQKALAVSNQILNGNSDVDNNTNPRLIPPEVIPNPTPNNVPLPPVRPSNLGDETTDTSTQAPPASAPQGGSTVPPPQNVNVKGVDPRLIDIYNEASKSLPEGYSVQLTSGYRAGDPRFHGQGKAVDFQITDANGNVLNNYQNLPAFRTYEQFAQSARKAQMQMYPELNDQLRWGGYFSGKTHPFGGPYGAVDIMHLDLGGDKVGMQGGSWAGGLTDAQRKLLQNKAISQGMGQGYASGGTPEADLSNQDKIVRDALLTANSMPKEDLFSGNLNQYNTNATLSDGNLSASFGSVNPIEQSSGASLYPMFNTTLGAQLSPKFNTSFTRQTPLSNSQSGSSNIASFGYNDSDISSNAQFGDTPSGRMYGATFGKKNADSNLNLFGNYTPKTHNFTGGVEYSKRFASGGMVDHALRKSYATDGTVTDPADTPTAGDYQPTGDPDLDTALQQISDAKKEMDQGATEYKQPISERIQSGASAGFGSQPIGYNPEDQQKIDDISKQYPYLEMPLNIAQGIYQSVATPISLAGRGINALVGGTSGAIAGTYGEATGADETDVNKLQRDLNSLGQSALIETGRTGDIPAVKEEAPIINNTPIVDKALSKIPEEPEPLPTTNIPETSKPFYSQVDPEGNLNLRPSVKVEDLKGPDVQTVDSFINQLKGKQGFTPDSLEEIKSQFADTPTVSKDYFANNMPASQYNKEPLEMQNYDQAKNDIDSLFNSHYEDLPQIVANKVLKDGGHSFYHQLSNNVKDYFDDNLNTSDIVDRLNLAENSANEFITLPVQVKYFLSKNYGINNYKQLSSQRYQYNAQTIHGLLTNPELYPEFSADYNSKLNQARNNLINNHNVEIDNLNNKFGNSNVIIKPKYQNAQRLVLDKDNPSLRQNYFEMGVSHPNFNGSYKHFRNFNNGIGHFRGTMTPDGASILNADKPGEDLSQSMLQTKPNSAVIEEIQSDAQQTNQQTGPLRQVHGVVAKAAIQHALENGANTIYFPTSKPIIARRIGPKESWENIPDKVNQATALHRIYDKEVPKFALDEIKKIPGVTHSMTDGGFYHVFDFNDAAKDRILNGAGMRTPGYKKGGAVVNQALSVLSGGMINHALRQAYLFGGSPQDVDPNDPSQWLNFAGQSDDVPTGVPLIQSVGTDAAVNTAKGVSDAVSLPHDVMTGEVDPMSDEGIQRAIDLALTTMGGGVGGVEEGGTALGSGPIRAYHGSPHSFEQFDLSKIGTGEGAAAYGHGIYLAENEPVAIKYRDDLSKDLLQTPSGEIFNPDNLQHLNVRVTARNSGTDLNPAIQKAQEIINSSSLPDKTINLAKNDLEKLQSIQSSGQLTPYKGHVYEVNINADPERFIDWDKPLSEQHPDIQQILDNHVNKMMQQTKPENQPMSHWLKQYNEGTLPGSSVYRALGNGSDVLASQKWSEQGIPGIKYLDQGSRANAYRVELYTGNGKYAESNFPNTQQAKQYASEKETEGFKTNIVDQGKRNRVIFDPKDIEIQRKYEHGGSVVNHALSVSSKNGSTLPDADVILRQLKRGRP